MSAAIEVGPLGEDGDNRLLDLGRRVDVELYHHKVLWLAREHEHL